jgi:hypothetical protein
MAIVKTSDLIGPALDWAVAKCEGAYISKESDEPFWLEGIVAAPCFLDKYQPSTDWSQGGPIIEREGIEIRKGNPLYFPQGNERGDYYEPLWLAGKQHGTTALIVAMRCYVASKLGDTVEVPEELL